MDVISIGSGLAIGLVIGGGIVFLLIKKALEKGNKALVEEAKAEGQVLKERKIIEAKEKFLQLKSDHEKLINGKNQKMQQAEQRVKHKETKLNQKLQEVNKSEKSTEQFFLFKNDQTEEVYFNPYFTLTKNLTVVSHFNPETTFAVEYFNTNHPASPPPFSNNRKLEIATYKDSSFLLDMNNTTGFMTMPKKGSYCIKHTDSVNYSVILQLLDFLNSLTQASIVAPVVITSSINKMCLLLK